MRKARIPYALQSRLKTALFLFASTFSAISYAQAVPCDAKSFDRFRAAYPLLVKCAKLTNSEGHSMLVIGRTQSNAVFRLEVSDKLRSELENVIFMGLRADGGTAFLQSISVNQDPLQIGLPALFWPKFNADSDSVEIDFYVLSEQSGRSAFARALTERNQLEVRLATADRKVHDITFDLSSSQRVLLDTLGLDVIHQSGALQNIESFSQLNESASKSCERSATQTPYWKCMEPVERCAHTSNRDAKRLKVCLDGLPK